MVKADAYGHGARRVSEAAALAGAKGLAVVTLEEAAEVRGIVPDDQVLVMGGLLAEDIPAAVEGGYALACSSLELARQLAAAAAGRQVPIHLKVDTGMGRYGAAPADVAELAAFIESAPGLRLAGVWSHLASSESDPAYSLEQRDRFEAATAGLRAVRHLANSGGVMNHAAEMAFDAVRVGIALYGCEGPGLRPVLSLRARVAHLKEVAAGTPIGYGRTWTAAERARIATVTIGYADGVHRSRSGRGWVLLRGRRAPLVGTVSMDSITIDVTGISEVAVGDAVTLIGVDGEERISAERVAEWSGTISYEVLTSLSKRVVRIYRGP
ncbi:MAG: alanine racemase [Candidatus Dormibacteraceae bacterium]